MFAAGKSGPADPAPADPAPEDPAPEDPAPEETREYEVVAVEEDESIEVIEDEAWDGDEYEEWEEELEAPEAEEKRSPGEDFKAWWAEFRTRGRAIGARIFGRVGAIKLPRHEIDGQKALAVAGIAVVAGLVGAGGYLLGKGSGDDLDMARLEGEFAGKRAGAIEGATKGYATGFKKGRDLAFRKSYSASYRRNYIRAYENAGIDPPKAKSIEVPEP